MPNPTRARRETIATTITVRGGRSSMRPSGKGVYVVVAVAALLVWLLFAYQRDAVPTPRVAANEPGEPAPSKPPASAPDGAPAPTAAAVPLRTATPRSLPAPGSVARLPVAKEGTRARLRPWVKATWGNGEGQIGLGYLGGSTELYTPQGFVATRDGKLLVLDSNNSRVVQYDAKGGIERTLAVGPLVMPADVAVARDGTIIVADHGGLQTRGLVLLRPDGSLRELPQIQPGLMMGLYAVGNDFYFDLGGEGSIRGGDTSGNLSDETPGVYNYEDQELVPGLVAPDGTTVITLGVEDGALPRGELYVGAMRGEPPEHLFTHQLVWPRPLAAVMYAAADARGQIYVVVVDGPSQRAALVCLDAAGHPVGTVDMGDNDTSVGTYMREYNVAPDGGLVYQRLSEAGVAYDWYDCH